MHNKRGPQKAHRGKHALTLWISLGNISEQGKERMPRQRLVLRWPQSLHGKASRAAGAVPLSSPGTSCWKHRGSSILFSQEGRLSWTGGITQYGFHSGWCQVNVCEQQACSCRHRDDFSWPQASAQRPLPVAASMKTKPTFPQEIKGCTLLLAMQTSDHFEGDCTCHHPGMVPMGEVFG